MRLNSLPIFVLALAPFADPVYAERVVDLGTGAGWIDIIGQDISSNGSVVVGNYGIRDTNGNYSSHMFRWTANGMETLVGLPNTQDQEAWAVSANGNVVVGFTQFNDFSVSAWRWENDAFQQLGGSDTVPVSDSWAFDVSADGNRVVGASLPIGLGDWQATVWDSGIPYLLGYLQGDNRSTAYGVSANGLVVVGTSTDTGSNPDRYRAFRWEDSTMIDLGTLMTDQENIIANATSENGSVVVGTVGNFDWLTPSGGQTNDSMAFRWVQGVNGAPATMSDLGVLSGDDRSRAFGVSADGNVVVGDSAQEGMEGRAFRWENGIMTQLPSFGAGHYSTARGITGDGTVVVGQATIDADDLIYHAVVWTAGAAIDINNTSTAIEQTATNTQAFFDQRSAALSAGMAQACGNFGANGLCVSLGGRATSVQDGFTDTVGVLNVGYRVSDTLHVGAFIDDGSTSASSNSFSVGSSKPAFGAFAAYSEASDGKGLQSRFSAAWHSDTVDITRAVLSDTEAGRGQANVDASMVSAELGYGMMISPTMMATPFAGWHYGSVTRDAYSEAASDTVVLPISYAAFSQKQSSAVLGTRLDAVISDNLSLLFQVGGEVELSSSRTSFAGTSGIPGLTGFGLNDDGAGDEVRVFGSAGARYDLDKTQRLIATVLGSGQLNGNAGYTVMAGYQIGF